MTQTGDNAAKKHTLFFYGYVIVAASFFIIFIMHGMYSSYGVYFSALQAEFGWNRATISAAQSLVFILAGTFSVVPGRLTDKLGPRVVMTISGLIIGLGYFLTSRVDTILQLFLFYGVIIGIGNSSVNVTQLSTTVRWFIKRRGMMSGIVKVGTGAGIFIMPLIAGWFIAAQGWRNAYLVLGLIAMVSVILVSQLLKRDPAQMGLKPYGAEEVSAKSAKLAGIGLSFQEALRTRQLWTICIIYFIAWYIGQTNTVHMVANGPGCRRAFHHRWHQYDWTGSYGQCRRPYWQYTSLSSQLCGGHNLSILASVRGGGVGTVPVCCGIWFCPRRFLCLGITTSG
jgi:MFS family permease